ncbi:MAG TPA: FtsW/RodA/SpoVE family cell cycle protein [Bacteroidia bacterium]|nr:FtsW/RodA/SpoVE family cell cycle protein [Bacteroidia bacterium]HQK96848.1 FtsW/RodA/SpoVE family cell cycle protein [Bacteroidia bacterium]
MTWLETHFKGDRTIWLIVILLSFISTLAVYSSTGTLAYKYQSGNTEYYILKHAFILAFGFGLMYMFHLASYTVYARFARLAFIITVPLLILTLFMGTNINDANRWITLPIIGLSFQTSDLAKLSLILYLARLISKKQESINDFKASFVPIVIPVFIVCGLILPANFSTAAVLFSTSMVLMFIGRVPLKFIFGLLGTAVLAFALFIGIAKLVGYNGRISTWGSRIENFRSKKSTDEGDYQVQQAKIAIATGGIFGKGPGQSAQRNFLPHPYSDFIFAIIIEEYGLAGGCFVVLLYLMLFYRAIQIVRRTERAFAAMITIGCAFSLVFQALINMAVAVHIFPVTGQPLPMLSMGGTSIWFTSFAIGIILSVSSEIDKKVTNKTAEVAVA